VQSKCYCVSHTVLCILVVVPVYGNTAGSDFMTGLRSQIFGCKSNNCKTSTVEPQFTNKFSGKSLG
jgi:hypothetical protein